MAWKNQPYWLKGGIIGLIILILLYIISILLIYINLTEYSPLSFLAQILLFPLVLCNGEECRALIFAVPFIIFFEFIVIGALIGWLYGRIKLKREKNETRRKRKA
jgi:hypothetical protein